MRRGKGRHCASANCGGKKKDYCLVHFASSDYCGTISKGYDKLLKIIAKNAYPGDFGSIDVDVLRST